MVNKALFPLLLFTIVCSCTSYGQDIPTRRSAKGDSLSNESCLEKVVFKTGTMREGIDSIYFTLFFKIDSNTVIITNNEDSTKLKNDDIRFKIIEKSCKWNTARSEGKSIYKLFNPDSDDDFKKYPILTVERKDGKGQITLKYTDQQLRIFDIITTGN
jgi:hypothetical protein